MLKQSAGRLLTKPASGVLAALRLNVRKKFLGDRKYWRDFFVRQDPG
jgi:hypothetical protein